MISIKDFTIQELLEQVSKAQEDMDNAEYDTGDYHAAQAELKVAQKELEKRNQT